MLPRIIIAIDGYAGCGKSTLAKSLAHKLQYKYLDTGAMYRALTLYFLRLKIEPENTQAIVDNLDLINIDFKPNEKGKLETYLNNENVENEIRGMAVSSKVTSYAAMRLIRENLVAQQQRLGLEKGIVLDGRDIGTVVFPNAELKFFVTADLPTRAKRRLEEFTAINPKTTIAEVIKNLHKRDHDETTRAESPLIQAKDAIVIDTTHLSKTEAVEVAWQHFKTINNIP